ncbi:MAG: cytochrome c [Anaerolineae bacterium]|nr:cytochrome c [Anaerolineae bacterium]
MKRSGLLKLFLPLLVVLVAACEGLAGEPAVVGTLPVSRPLVDESIVTTPEVVAPPEGEADVALGAQIYAANCTRCHGLTGQGDGELVQLGQVVMPIDFTDPATSAGATPEEWFSIITNGRLDKLMPPWADKLSADERWAVTMYLFTLSQNPPQVQPQVAGLITGNLVSGTAGAALPVVTNLRLHVLNQEFALEQTLDGQVADDGSFQFSDIAVQSGNHYVVSVESSGVTFASDIQSFSDGEAALNIPVPVYEFTTDSSVLQIDRLLSQVEVVEGDLQVVQLLSIVNTSDRAFYDTETSASIRIALPEGAQPLQFGDESRRFSYSADGREIIDTAPVMPGDVHTVHLSYAVPYTGSAEIQQVLDFPLNNGFEVLVAQPGISVSGANVAALGAGFGGMMSFGNAEAQVAGTPITFTVSGEVAVTTTTTTTTAGGGSSQPSPVAVILIALGVLALVAALVLYLRERGQNRTSPQSAAPGQERINELVKQIADLDMEHQTGKIAKKIYEKRRIALKAELMRLVKQSEQNAT